MEFSRILRRRRRSAVAVCFLAFAAFVAVALAAERPVYRARARVRSTVTPALVEAAKNAPWIEFGPEPAPIETSSPSTAAALASADGAAELARGEGAARALRAAGQTREHLAKAKGGEEDRRRTVRRERDTLAGQGLDWTTLQEDLRTLEARKRDLLLRKSTNAIRVLTLRDDRAFALHFPGARPGAGREEFSLLVEDDKSTAELRALEPALLDLRHRAHFLEPFLNRIRSAEAEVVEATARVASLEILLARLEACGGFTAVEEPARMLSSKQAGGLPYWILALCVSTVAGLGAAFTVEAATPTIRSQRAVERRLGWPVLGTVPDGPTEDLYDTLATLLLASPSDRPGHIFLVAGTDRGEGRTRAALDLAGALAHQGKRTLLLDGDLRHPSLHGLFGVENGAGLADLLSGQAMPGTAGIFHDTWLPTLKLLTSGDPGADPREILDPARILPLAGQLREQFDAVVVDTPSLLEAGDALKFADATDAVLFVIQAGRTDARRARRARQLLDGVHAKTAGVLLNRA